MTKNKTDITTRAIIITLKAPCSGKLSAEIALIIGLPIYIINSIYAHAIDCGFEPNASPLVICDKWLQDAPRSSRPSKQTAVKEEILQKVHCDPYGWEKLYADIARELSSAGFNISQITV